MILRELFNFFLSFTVFLIFAGKAFSQNQQKNQGRQQPQHYPTSICVQNLRLLARQHALRALSNLSVPNHAQESVLIRVLALPRPCDTHNLCH